MLKGYGRKLLAATCLVLLVQGSVYAAFKGEADLEGRGSVNGSDSLDAVLGARNRFNEDLTLRFMWSGERPSGWGFDATYLVEASHGGDVRLARRLLNDYPSYAVDPRKSELFHLNHTLTDHGRTYLAHRLDRLAVDYSGARLIMRLGRQALTWGGGLVFRPLDLFNPFPPNATYTTYKPGSDMLYGQWLFDSGADLQGVVVPRRNPETGKVAANQSSAGIKWHGYADAGQQISLDLLLAQDYRDQVLGLSASGAAGGATWTAEIVPTRLDGGALRISFLANTQYAWIWDEKNLNGYLEYFRNGFGTGGATRTLATLPQALSQRLSRGELFTIGKDYLAAGIDMQWTPLLALKPSVISNLDDGSALLIGQTIYSLSQNTDLTLGLQLGLGSHETEYGGIETASGTKTYSSPADRFYARLTWYF